MKLLAIDTTTEQASVGLLVGSSIQHQTFAHLREHARFILPSIDTLLSQAQLSLSQLDGIVFGRGPGSFTGLRIACSVAKGLGFAHDLPLFPVSSLITIHHQAQQHYPHIDHILTVIDARMQQLYWQYHTNNKVFTEKVADVQEIEQAGISPKLIAGWGYEPYQAALKLAFKDALYLKVYPSAHAMLSLALSQALQPVSAAKASPVYIRNSVT
ncbi:MAG TPA: tRNA (adenosine(37)-N6)-threonylcarbamoyltransferase complex dimerization subunit type 1 TsaB [Legionellales bacterium]|nr:tRNA (adenosine(37)-N6)-threonylcarbamoyltransferase complex dimerization subunit type 1 TsaB [Legionellales bacterium]HCA90049.1 tRNA (adenosine(37)-N6)-threonylcarbamoyltransferase complex dimerization subunit type 1 TsaB [Legionellales bacterium]|tara:strand:- start:511 stop:1149 length:639 start_codon:yes stop_codon:yes gene_type:complete